MSEVDRTVILQVESPLVLAHGLSVVTAVTLVPGLILALATGWRGNPLILAGGAAAALFSLLWLFVIVVAIGRRSP